MEEIKIIYEKYCMCEYDIGDVSRMLSYIAVPDSISDLVSEAENEIEYIRFMVSENEQYNRVKDVLLKILSNDIEYSVN